MKLDPFYLIVDHVGWLRRLLPCGVKLAQLRVKQAEDLREQIAEARDLCKTHGAQLIVNDHWRLALDLGCDFVHLGQEDLLSADLNAIKAGGLKLGISTHDEAELQKALDAEPDYVALGPIFPTILKKMPWAPQGFGKIALWRQKIGALPLVAIGGLTPERAQESFKAGADSAAVVTDISLNPDPEARCREWIAATRRPISAA
ncbi:thiamine-phosphate pyrophosphorylase [Rhodoblastus acidophilus]|uniref:thiamine phosphate synthase n=1 Tax=Rhodoblastus acidophilus TaxID=1074 RepID=UPI002225B180|nr:thiamine phosphate synthase [Rhodoblastus acidophilus]MCW2286412.1 thiamine-phosphate pyrophosphorylase [Rhodoblastus acidophilus]MCW2335261.1 thiamine-phosphate pyrophosphorylase [Rhodoblastus acidophilus]